MKNILNAPFVTEMRKMTANMYRLGWDERNGGNISYLLDNDEVAEYLDINKPIRRLETGFDAKDLAGKIFIVTGTGKYFKNVEKDPETNLGIVRIDGNGGVFICEATTLPAVVRYTNFLKFLKFQETFFKKFLGRVQGRALQSYFKSYALCSLRLRSRSRFQALRRVLLRRTW